MIKKNVRLNGLVMVGTGPTYDKFEAIAQGLAAPDQDDVRVDHEFQLHWKEGRGQTALYTLLWITEGKVRQKRMLATKIVRLIEILGALGFDLESKGESN